MKTLTIDIETTGIPAKGATYEIDFLTYPRILSLAYKIDDKPTEEFIIAQNGFQVPPEATTINGITQQMADESPHQLEGILIGLLEFEKFDFIIGHNIYFDTSIIKANILRLIEEGRVTKNVFEIYTELLHKDKRIDTMRAGMKICGGKWPKLTELYSKLFGGEFDDAHSASADVDACYKCAVKMGLIPTAIPVVVEEEI